MQVDDLPQLLVENGIWVRPFLSPPVFSADVLRNDGYMFRLCRRLALGLLQPAGYSRREAQQISLLILKEGAHSCTSEAPPAEEFPGFAWTPGVRKVDDFPPYAAKWA